MGSRGDRCPAFLVSAKPLNFDIRSLTAHNDHLIVGTKEGHLIMYKITPYSTSDYNKQDSDGTTQGVEWKLLRSRAYSKNKKPIQQLQVVSQLSLLIVLTNDQVSVCDLDQSKTHFQTITSVGHKAGSCVSFATKVQVLKSPGSNTNTPGRSGSILLRLACAVGRGGPSGSPRIQQNRKFEEVPEPVLDIGSAPGPPRSMAWIDDIICCGGFGTSTDNHPYVMFDVSGGGSNTPSPAQSPRKGGGSPQTTPSSTTTRVLDFGPGSVEACVSAVHVPSGSSTASSSLFALTADNRTVLVDGKGTRLSILDWSAEVTDKALLQGPKAVVHSNPYLVALHEKSLTVATWKPKATVQTVGLSNSKPRLIATSSDSSQLFAKGGSNSTHSFVYVVSETQMWILSSVPVAKQLKQLIRDKQFERAVALLTSQPDVDQQKVNQLEERHAFDLFCQGKYQDSLDKFFALDTVLPDYYVIGLYGDLLPKEVQAELNELYPEPLPQLEEPGANLEEAIRQLIQFLMKTRNKTTLEIHNNNLKNKSKSVEVLDTTLVKCYLKVYDQEGRSILTSFLRSADKQCHLRETETVLKDAEKYDELTVFYRTRGLHKKALKMLKKLFDKTVKGVENYGSVRTVAYLTRMEDKDIDLVCEFAEPIVKASPDVALGIFTEETPEMNVESWDRSRAYNFLTRSAPKDVVIRYLEFIISNWGETVSFFHNALVLHYKDVVTVAKDEEGQDVNAEETLAKLRAFLETSKHYRYYYKVEPRAESVLSKFPKDCLYEERALLLGSLGRHLEAISIHLFKLRSKPGAQEYCSKHAGGSPEVYTLLYRLLTKPPDGNNHREMEMCGLTQDDLEKTVEAGCVPDIDLALKVLYSPDVDVDVMTVVDCTPSSVPLEKLSPYFESALEGRLASRHQTQLHRGLLHSEHLQIQEERIAVEADKVIVSEDDVCPSCKRNFRTQVLVVRLPGGQVICYNCQDKVVAC